MEQARRRPRGSGSRCPSPCGPPPMRATTSADRGPRSAAAQSVLYDCGLVELLDRVTIDVLALTAYAERVHQVAGDQDAHRHPSGPGRIRSDGRHSLRSWLAETSDGHRRRPRAGAWRGNGRRSTTRLKNERKQHQSDDRFHHVLREASHRETSTERQLAQVLRNGRFVRPQSCDTGGGDLISEGQEHRTEPEGLDLDRAEAGRAQHAGGLIAQLAPLEHPAPGAPDDSLNCRDARAARRRYVLDRHEPATRSEHAPHLGDHARRIGHSAEDEGRADEVDARVGERECLATRFVELEREPVLPRLPLEPRVHVSARLDGDDARARREVPEVRAGAGAEVDDGGWHGAEQAGFERAVLAVHVPVERIEKPRIEPAPHRVICHACFSWLSRTIAWLSERINIPTSAATSRSALPSKGVLHNSR